MSNIKMAIEELHKAFDLLNMHKFNGELPEPAILTQNQGNRKNILGWCTTKEVWGNIEGSEKKYEITICAEFLNMHTYDLMSTLLHEMVHLYNITKGIQDTSRGNSYHNKEFKKQAELRGLVVSYDKKIGWSPSELSEDTKKLVDSFKLNPEAFILARQPESGGRGPKKPSHIKKLVCPKCGLIARITRGKVKGTEDTPVSLLCGTCMEQMIMEGASEEDEEESEN